MIRKILATAILLPISFSSLAATGPYIGLGFGPDSIDFQQFAHVSQPGNFDVTEKNHLAGFGVFGTLFGGYGWMYNWFYLAGEINGNISSARYKSFNREFVHSNFSDTTYKIQSNWGISALPGFIYGDTLIYARLGYTNGQFKTVTTDVSLANVSEDLDGFRVGAGFTHMLQNPHWSVRMEWSYINYDKTQFTTFDAGSTTTKRTIIHPQTNQVEFSLIYNFDVPMMVSDK